MVGVYVFLVCMACVHVTGVHVTGGYRKNRTICLVKLPSRLLSLDDFDRYVASGKTLPQIYFGLPVKPSVTVPVFIQSEKRFIKTGKTRYGDGLYSRVLRGVTEKEPYKCQTLTFNACVLRNYSGNRAELVVDSGFLQVFWSSFPEKYIWFIQCLGGRPGYCKCHLKNIRIGLLVQTIDRSATFPWKDIVRDLNQTSLTFESPQMNWLFTFGKNRLCPIV